MISKERINIPMILIEATIPNSFNRVLSVMIKVANPEAVVTLVIRVAFPILAITRCNESALLPCFWASCWYLLMRKIQLGIPITMIKGGINAVSTVISYSSNPNTPKDHITQIITTAMEIIVALTLLKKKKNIIEVTPIAPNINKPISSIMLWAFIVLM